ncbi:RagB/SusD family nutrient uptake outer membrane protein [Sphingobacterium lumbrici]|uniref:RagB/SusD family nutrient uptake outer membrane protein n=1 Tax=Sphingobacterium lumbrici TaxID=2559600 RepID=UPI0015E3BF7D|nr:RagB/SusD family nutrient uptake outer membrane protein [Sphingobacterium lumbrici]
MKKLKYLLMITALVCGTSSCDKFLNVTPIDALSGNNFWQTQKDVEGYMNGIYTKLRNKVGNSILIPALDIRGNSVKIATALDASGNGPINNLISNNMNPIISGTTTYDTRLKEVMNWKGWYDVIAASNILYYEVDNVPAAEMSQRERDQYKAEAVFTRNLSYMFICKLYGDAIYYTEAYHNKALARTPQVEVLNNCIADMLAAKDNLPIKYSESSLLGVRPTRASAVALLMHLNMWAATWDTGDKKPYYQAVLDLADELDTYTDYSVLRKTAANTKLIFKGRTAENLFGILQDYNYGETFAQFSNYSFFFSRYPYRGASTKTGSHMTYERDYIEKLYPPAIADDRKAIWFENYNSDNASFQFKKFINVYSSGTGTSVVMNNDDSAILLRMSDVVLLAAEAAAELEDDVTAKEYLNRVRGAAGAPMIISNGATLKDDIYRERCRELIGEGHFYFDLVRTKRVVNTEFSKAVMSGSSFNSGAWRWPLIITTAEQNANPNLTGNNYWN